MKTAKTQPFPIGDSFVPTCPEPGSVAEGIAEQLPLRRVLDRAGRDGARHARRTLVGADDVQPADEPDLRARHDHQLRVHAAASGVGRREPAVQVARRGAGFFRPTGVPRAGTLTAMDPTTNKIVWQKRMKFPLGTGSGLLSTAAGLLFHGESDGNIVAYDIANGEIAVELSDRRRRRCAGRDLRSERRAVRRDARRRQFVPALAARRQPLGVQARGQAAAAARAARAADDSNQPPARR